MSAGPWTAAGAHIFSAPAGENVSAAPANVTSTLGALPRETALLALDSGGVAPLDGSGNAFLASAWIWYLGLRRKWETRRGDAAAAARIVSGGVAAADA